MRADDLYSAICREALESRQRDVMSFVDNGMTGMSARLEKTLFRLPDGHYLLGLGPYNAGLVRLDFEELLIGREVPEFIGVGTRKSPACTPSSCGGSPPTGPATCSSTCARRAARI
jgi:hypothetical protein